MRIVLVYSSLKNYWEERLCAFCEHCIELGDELKVIELFGRNSLYGIEDNGYQRHGWWECLFPDSNINTIGDSQVRERLFEILDGYKPDVVVTGALTFPCGFNSFKWAKLRGKGVVMFDDVLISGTSRNPVKRMVRAHLCRRVQAYFVPASDYAVEWRSWGAGQKNVFEGLCCVNNQRFGSVSREEMEEYFRNSDLDIGRRYMLCVSRLVPIKNVKRLIEVWSKAYGFREDVGLIIVGDGGQVIVLQEVLLMMGVRNVHIVGALRNTEVQYYYALASAFILVSHLESWGLVVNEAMAAGLPVIVSKQCNCSRYLVDDGVNGYLVDADLDETIFEAIKILESPGRLADFGIASRRMIQDFGLEKFARNLWAACSYVMSVDQGKLDIFSRGLMVFWRARINMKRFNG